MGARSPETARTGDDYIAFCEGVRRLAQLDLLQYRRGQMERRVRTFAQRRGAAVLADYLALLEREREELDRFLDRVTINVSQLWRNPAQWRLLAATVLPELNAQSGRIRAWSAGGSYGAEAYTLAAVAREVVSTARVEILGSDIDPRMVARAREGFFSEDDARDAPRASLERWFDRVSGGWKAKQDLARLVRFEVANLLTMNVPREAYDVVLCRNVVIYFTADVRDALHGRLVQSLRPGGYLVIGSTERVTAPAELGVQLVHPFVYRKAQSG
jgi:chemotaxis protein methyltransferase CheR